MTKQHCQSITLYLLDTLCNLADGCTPSPDRDAIVECIEALNVIFVRSL